jgi:hypothetical protein
MGKRKINIIKIDIRRNIVKIKPGLIFKAGFYRKGREIPPQLCWGDQSGLARRAIKLALANLRS